MNESRHRTATRRRTKETDVEVVLDLDGSGTTDCSTGIPFYDHMLDRSAVTAAST